MTTESPLATVQRLLEATNRHDLDAVVAAFTDDYTLTAPAHPQRSFSGSEQVRRNWTQIFAAVPNLETRILRSAVDGDTVWSEWEMAGTRRDGAKHTMRGVFIFGVAGGKIGWGRMFLEPVDEAGGDMNAAVRSTLQAKP